MLDDVEAMENERSLGKNGTELNRLFGPGGLAKKSAGK
jgi:hypothetical protein